MLNGDQDDDPDEQEDLKFGHLVKENVKLLRLQGDMTHQVRFFVHIGRKLDAESSRNARTFSTSSPNYLAEFYSARMSLLEAWTCPVSRGSFNIIRLVPSITFIELVEQLD